LEQDVVDDRLVLPCHRPQKGRQGKDQMEVGYRQEVGFALLDPLSAGQRLAPVAVPVATGVVGVSLVLTRVTAFEMPAQSGSAAGLHGLDDTPLLGRSRVLEEVGRGEATEDVGYFKKGAAQAV
jgi:hypothetical protein